MTVRAARSPRRRGRAVATVAVAAASLAAAGCGTPSADLFVVERSGELPDADLHLVVGDGGAVECDGEERPISSDRLLEARDLARDLAPLLERGVRLPPGERSLLRFEVTGEEGTIAFSEGSPGLRPVMARVVRFTRDVARDACGRER